MKGGFSLFTYQSDFISQWMRFYREYEAVTVNIIRDLLPEGTTLLDAGANLGVISLGVAARRPDVQVCCFECNPRTIEHLEASIKHNRLQERIRVFPVGLSDRLDSLDFYHDDKNTGASCLVGGGGAEMAASAIKVPVVRLDSYDEFREHLAKKGQRIGCLKMDIQGAEYMALSGMEELLREHRPALVVEMDDVCLRQFGSSEVELRRLIAGFGYRVVREVEGNVVAIAEDV